MARTLALLTVLMIVTAAWGQSYKATLTNATKHDLASALAKLDVRIPMPFDSTRVRVTENGKPIPHQVLIRKGSRTQVLDGEFWVLTSIPSGQSRQYEITITAEPVQSEPRVKVTRQGDEWILDNGTFATKLQAHAQQPRELPGPINGIRVGEQWTGQSRWSASVVSNGFQSQVLADGTLFAEVELVYFFIDPSYGGTVPFAAVTVRLGPGWNHLQVTESHAMYEGDRWLFDLTSESREGMIGLGNQSRATPLKAPSDGILARLQPPRDDAPEHPWFFVVNSGQHHLGAAAIDSPPWEEPLGNRIDVQFDAKRSMFTLGLPTHSGTRSWLLFAGKGKQTEELTAQMRRHSR